VMPRQRMIYSGAIMATGGLMLAVCGVILTSSESSTAPGFVGILMLVVGVAGLFGGLGLAITGFRRKA